MSLSGKIMCYHCNISQLHSLAIDLTHNAVIAGERLFLIEASHKYFEWEECGLSIHVQENSVPPLSTCEMKVSALAGGDFSFPKNHELVSAVYAVAFSNSLQKDVIIELQHCVDLQHQQQISKCSFAVASPLPLPNTYSFNLIEGGRFCIEDQYGSIDISESLCYCIVMGGCNSFDFVNCSLLFLS